MKLTYSIISLLAVLSIFFLSSFKNFGSLKSINNVHVEKTKNTYLITNQANDFNAAFYFQIPKTNSLIIEYPNIIIHWTLEKKEAYKNIIKKEPNHLSILIPSLLKGQNTKIIVEDLTQRKQD